MSKSHQVAQDIRTLLDRLVTIDAGLGTGEILTKMLGNLEMRNVHFQYPNTPNRIILNDLSFSIEPGQSIGLVGASGCGQSTIIALLERFFHPGVGQTLVDGENSFKLNIKNYRIYLTSVGPEPDALSGDNQRKYHHKNPQP